jgi:hypothetical protein
MNVSKLQKARDFWHKSQYLAALRIVAKFPNLGSHKAQIVRGYECVNNPAFYERLGYNPAQEYAAALAAVATLYGLPAASQFQTL